MSSNLLWQLVKNNNCYRVAQRNGVFSSDPFNSTGKQNFTDCGIIVIIGLVQRTGVAFSAVKDAKTKNVSFKVSLKKR